MWSHLDGKLSDLIDIVPAIISHSTASILNAIRGYDGFLRIIQPKYTTVKRLNEVKRLSWRLEIRMILLQFSGSFRNLIFVFLGDVK